MPSRLNGFDYRMKWHIIQWPPSLPVSKAVNLHGNQRQMKTLPIDAAYPTWHREVFEVLSWSLRVNSRASCGAEPNCGIMQLARPHWHALLSSTQSLKKSSPRSIVSELPNCAQLVGAKASPTDRWPRAHRAPQGLNASTKEKKTRAQKRDKTNHLLQILSRVPLMMALELDNNYKWWLLLQEGFFLRW